MMAEIEKKWAACIVYYQDQESLSNLLDSLQSQSLKPTAVFIADNNSNQSPVLGNFSFPVTITKLPENRGFAAGANTAIRNAIKDGFEYLMLLSQDVLLSNDSAEKLIHQQLITKGITFPTMMNRNTNKVFSKGGVVNKFWGSITLSTKKPLLNPDWADGSCLFFSKEVFEKVNGLFEKFFMYFEDVDFCLRAKKSGFRINHAETLVSQTPKGPNPLLRSKNSVMLARRTGSILFKSSVTKRNLLGAGLLLARFKPQEAANRVKGIIQGWVAEIE
jgi:GT2 family glycosyltransferase